MRLASGAALLDHIIERAHEIIDECPSCAGTASEIAMWVNEIRKRRPHPHQQSSGGLMAENCRSSVRS